MAQDRTGVAALTRWRVLIADDNPQVRQELRTLLPLAADLEIVGEAADGLEATRLAQTLEPDVILLDLEMPVMDGYQAARQIRAACPSCRLVALTVYGDAASRDQAAEAGVDVFLVKGVSVETLVQAISNVSPSPGGAEAPQDPWQGE